MTTEKPTETTRVARQAKTPAWLELAMAEQARGIREVSGVKASARILRYLAATRLRGTKMALSDETPWCSAFMCWLMSQSGLPSTRSAAARSWLKWGGACGYRIGAVAVLWRGGPNASTGHVGLYVGGDLASNEIWLLGGNQHNRVCVRPYALDRLLGLRWPSGLCVRCHADLDQCHNSLGACCTACEHA